MYKKLVIYYFSGTGNSKNVAQWVAEVANVNKICVELFNIDELRGEAIEVPEENSLVGFISPTHGFNFPAIMRKFIHRFPKSKDCSAFIMNARAGVRIGRVFLPGLSGVLHYWFSLVLKLKSYKVVGGFPVDLPSNWISIHPAVREKSVELIYENVKPKVKAFATKILLGGKSYRAFYDIIQDIIISPVSILYNLFGKYLFAKSFIASPNCDKCDICRNSCPVDAIKIIDNRMYWTSKCESCMRCMNKCPKDAIETAHGFIGIMLLITSIITSFVVDMIISNIEIDWFNPNIERVIKSFIVIPILIVGYRLLHWSMRFRMVALFFSFTSLCRYKFWGRFKLPKKYRRNKI